MRRGLGHRRVDDDQKVEPLAREAVQQQDRRFYATLLGMVDLFSGGNLRRLSIFALGIMPYISASIIMQLCTVVVPTLEALKKEGEAGRKTLNQYTRYLTVILAAFQSYGIAVGLEGAGNVVSDPGMFFRLSTAITSWHCSISRSCVTGSSSSVASIASTYPSTAKTAMAAALAALLQARGFKVIVVLLILAVATIPLFGARTGW